MDKNGKIIKYGCMFFAVLFSILGMTQILIVPVAMLIATLFVIIGILSELFLSKSNKLFDKIHIYFSAIVVILLLISIIITIIRNYS